MGILLAVIFITLKWLLRIYIYVLWARFIIDWIMVLNPRFRPRGIWLVLVELVFTLTDPPLKLIRRILPPIRLGQISLDLGWMLTLFACLILLALIPA